MTSFGTKVKINTQFVMQNPLLKKLIKNYTIARFKENLQIKRKSRITFRNMS